VDSSVGEGSEAIDGAPDVDCTPDEEAAGEMKSLISMPFWRDHPCLRKRD
jgi:hypothetical protein